MYTISVPADKTASKTPKVFANPMRHPLLFLAQRIQLLVYVAVGVTLGIYIVAGLYYLVFETYAPITNWWHHAVSNNEHRHMIRNVTETLVGGLLGKYFAWDHYKKKNQKRLSKKLNLVDRIEIFLHIPNIKDGKDFSGWQLAAMPVLVWIYAIPGFWVGVNIVDYFHHHGLHVSVPVSTNPSTTTFLEKLRATWTADWPQKLVGYFAVFVFGIRPARGVFDDMQQHFAAMRVARGLPLRWYHPATLKTRYTEIQAKGNAASLRLGSNQRYVMMMIGLIFFILMCVGFYVLQFVAK